MEQTEFPTKVYDGFALPSGEYLALRVVIGEGSGENWWCVVFPPLCTAAAAALEETALATGLGEEELSLMEALLAFALWQGASEAQEGRVARIPKKAVSEMLSKYKSEVQDGEEEFLVCFRTAEVPMNGGEQSAG